MTQSDRDPSLQDELLAQAAVFGFDSLTEDERDLLGAAGNSISDLEWTAAEMLVESLPVAEDMPADVAQRLRSMSLDVSTTDASSNEPITQELSAEPVAGIERPANSGRSFWMVGWSIAAGLLLGVVLDRTVLVRPPVEPTVAQRFEALLEQSGTQELAWTPNDSDGEGVTGRVVWNDRLDRGFMTFQGLAENDPRIEQYQLWIFDAERSAEHPVDGGVFDIGSSLEKLPSGELIVPIDSQLSVAKATLFAITIEVPGGVVVSDRSRLPLLAQVPE